VQLQEAQLQKRITVREAVTLWSSLYRTSVDGHQLLAQLGIAAKTNSRFMTCRRPEAAALHCPRAHQRP
jgi:ABC-2 type transport system ATP-binding protein